MAEFGTSLSRLRRAAWALCAIVSLGSALGQTWGTYQGNIGHTGYVPINVNTAGFGLLWQTQFPDGKPLSQPAGGDGLVFASEKSYFDTASLIAIDGACSA